MPDSIEIKPARFVTIALASTVTGLTKRAIQGKIDRGVWACGRQYRKGPDGRIYIDLQEFERWVITGV